MTGIDDKARAMRETATLATEPDRARVKATDRILAALTQFVSDQPDFGVTELAKELGMTKNMVYRAMTTLVDQGYLVRDASMTRYQIGFRVLELSVHDKSEPDLRTLCSPYIYRIHAITGESVSLGIETLDHVVMIDGIQTRLPGTYRMVIGGAYPLHATASGIAILSQWSDDAVDAYIDRQDALTVDHGRSTISSDRLHDLVGIARRDGFVQMVRKEGRPMCVIGYALKSSGATPHGAISFGGPADRLAARLPDILPEVGQIVRELTLRTGFYPPDPQQWAIS